MSDTIKAKAHALKPIMQIGKQGLSESVIEEIKKHLKTRKLIKIKCLRYFLDNYEGTNSENMKKIAKELQGACSCEIVSITGFTIVLWKKA